MFVLKKRYRSVWPIDEAAGRLPDGWHGWPTIKNLPSCLPMTLIQGMETTGCPTLQKLKCSWDSGRLSFCPRAVQRATKEPSLSAGQWFRGRRARAERIWKAVRIGKNIQSKSTGHKPIYVRMAGIWFPVSRACIIIYAGFTGLRPSMMPPPMIQTRLSRRGGGQNHISLHCTRKTSNSQQLC